VQSRSLHSKNVDIARMLRLEYVRPEEAYSLVAEKGLRNPWREKLQLEYSHTATLFSPPFRLWWTRIR